MSTPGKCVYGNVSRVRLPLSPPKINKASLALAFLFLRCGIGGEHSRFDQFAGSKLGRRRRPQGEVQDVPSHSRPQTIHPPSAGFFIFAMWDWKRTLAVRPICRKQIGTPRAPQGEVQDVPSHSRLQTIHQPSAGFFIFAMWDWKKTLAVQPICRKKIGTP